LSTLRGKVRGKSPFISSLEVIDRPETRCHFSRAKEKEKTMMWKGTPPEAARTLSGEGTGFELCLPMRVLGRDESGRDFEERTVLQTMSHAAAAFEMQSPVTRGADLKLIVSLPPKLSEAGNLNLVIRGRIISVGPTGPDGKGRRVSLKLESRYVIKPPTEEGAE
jgi:hypothetical protein